MKISGLQVLDEKTGKVIDNPSPFQIRMALVQLLEATGSKVISMTVDGHLIAYVMPGEDEVPDSLVDKYSKHLVTLAENFVEIAKSARRQVLNMSRGGSA